jgi:hypothetical protein
MNPTQNALNVSLNNNRCNFCPENKPIIKSNYLPNIVNKSSNGNYNNKKNKILIFPSLPPR